MRGPSSEVFQVPQQSVPHVGHPTIGRSLWGMRMEPLLVGMLTQVPWYENWRDTPVQYHGWDSIRPIPCLHLVMQQLRCGCGPRSAFIKNVWPIFVKQTSSSKSNGNDVDPTRFY
jgi:hypothetical protein